MKRGPTTPLPLTSQTLTIARGVCVNRNQSAHRQALAIVRNLDPPPGAVARRVLPLLVARTAENWHVLLGKNRTENGAPDVIAVGSTGVFVIKFADQVPDGSVIETLVDHVDRWSGRIRAGAGSQVLAGSAVHEAVVVPENARFSNVDTRVKLVRESRTTAWLAGKATSLKRAQREAITRQILGLLPEYTAISVDSPLQEPAVDGLLDANELQADQLESAQERPFEQWMTFLHPEQQQLVTRKYSGPARISGPAGTGKTVVALHRLRHLGRRSTGPLLFTTFVRTLPAVHRSTFKRLAQEFDDRVEFVNLHSWVGSFLTSRGIELTVDHKQALTLFNRAWAAHRAPLERIEPNPDYWRTEIDRVIKGRGLRTIEQYRAVSRPGRMVPLNHNQKQLIWDLYEAYQRNLAAKNLHDYNDVIDAALREVIANPLDHQYAAVVVDEVQDITLTGLRLLRELAGDGPDGLLLVGDGQQQVYTGGWRLSEAGIPIHGRGAVLKINYRNRAEVLTFAQKFDARNTVDDLDGTPGVGLRDVEAVSPGGSIRTWDGPRDAFGPALATAIKEMPLKPSALAVITFTKREVQACAAILRNAGIPFIQLDDYRGEPNGPIKLGTVHRAKGLDFQGVLVVDNQSGAKSGTAADAEQQRLRDRQYLVAATRARDLLWWGTVR